MTIRARLTLWYAGILFGSVLLITGLAYHEFAQDRNERRALPGRNRGGRRDGGPGANHRVLRHPGRGGGPGGRLVADAEGDVARDRADAGAARVHERNLSGQLPRTRNGDEVDQLTEVFNSMIARLDGSFNRIREFTLHASHELKTPLTVMHGELETALRDEHNSPATRERLLSQLDEIQRLSKIVDGLSLLTKADAGLVSLKQEPLQLDELVRDSYADAQILARPRAVRVELARCEATPLQGDRHRLRQLLLNLTDNAIKYNQPNGTVTIDLHRSNGVAELQITNTGPGIPTGLQPRVFDRCRPDAPPVRGATVHARRPSGSRVPCRPIHRRPRGVSADQCARNVYAAEDRARCLARDGDDRRCTLPARLDR